MGCVKHLAMAIMEAVNGPTIPKFETNSTIFGVSLNGTGRFPRSSPAIHFIY